MVSRLEMVGCRKFDYVGGFSVCCWWRHGGFRGNYYEISYACEVEDFYFTSTAKIECIIIAKQHCRRSLINNLGVSTDQLYHMVLTGTFF